MSSGGNDSWTGRLESFGRDVSSEGKWGDARHGGTDRLHRKILGKEHESEADRARRLAEEEEGRKQKLRDRIDAMFSGDAATQQFATEETELGDALRQQYSDDLAKRGGAAERALRFGAANTGNIGGTTFADASGKLNEENALGATRIEEAVRRAIAGLRTAREDSRLRAMDLVNGGEGENAVQSAVAGLRLASDNARAAGTEQLFNDLFGDIAYTKASGDSADKNAAALAYLQRARGGSYYPTQTQSSGRIIQTN